MYRVKLLIRKSLRGEITATEQAELEAWAAAAPENQALLNDLNNAGYLEAALARMDSYGEDKAWKAVRARMANEQYTKQPEKANIPVRRIAWRRWTVAAAILVLVGASTWWLLWPVNKVPSPAVSATQPNDVTAPTNTRATLTLSNGQQVYLDSAASGTLATQGNVAVVKGEHGQIAYRPVGSNAVTAVMYNTVTNPRGSRVVDMTLADGTHVWLNAASSIRYPTAFTGDDRAVEISGEAYFEVMHDAHKPFMVTRGTTRIQVLGTQFNVNAYDDEPNIKVTLLEGTVKVQEKESAVILQPGEQAIAPIGNVMQRLSKHGNTDIDAVMAWKNGLFAFNDADVPTIMRQLARWYDVDVHYEGAIPARTINGKIGQSLSLDQVLHVLTKLRIHYTIDGKNLTVRP